MSLVINGKGRHEMKTDKARKVFEIDLFGFYGVDDAEEFFSDYEKHTSKIPVKDFNIVINCKELSTFKPDILPYLKEAYKAYAKFKTVSFINPPSMTGKSQLKRIATEVGLLDEFNFIDSEKDLKLA